jgi:UDP:flavonoid glycosyltransferase YjiC (YdhE family)
MIFDGKEEQLQEALEQVYNTYLRFNRMRIAEVASKQFSYTTVGNEIDKVYKELIS